MDGNVQLRPGDEAFLEEVLGRVQRPSRYIGGEWNQVVKDHRAVDVTFALAFPDIYEIGMSHLGFRILYSLLNRREDTAAERVFCPWPDMADELRRGRRSLCSLESGTPLGQFDVVGFSLQYEMTFTNVLEMLDLAGIPVRSSDRGENDPLVIVGGPVVFNCEPLADFVDLVFVGDGEEMVPEFLDRLRTLKREGASRSDRIHEAAKIEGIYAPSLYDLERDERNDLLIPVPRNGAPYPVKRRILMDLDAFPFPDRIIVPHGEIVHDRVSIEIMRGCPVGCRFCQAGYVYRPTRERDPNQVRDTVIRSVRATGYDQFSLSSLNTGEYGAIHPVMFDLMDRFEPEKVSISLSSMHASTITAELAEQVRRVRKSGFTIAPEAGTQRMRDVINKNLSEEQILEACRLAYQAGWEQVKLYFMIGLPTETDADVDGMVDLAHDIMRVAGKAGGKRRRGEVTLSASSFIPKPETPFQWAGMERIENLYRKQDRIASRVRRGVKFKKHECETSYLEGVYSRGDRALGDALEHAWRGGARFDGWQEHLNRPAWEAAFRATGIDADRYAYRDLDPAGRLPWQVVHSQVNRKWLELELKRAMKAATLTVCGPTDCHGCAPFARECVKGIVKETTDRPLDPMLPVLSTSCGAGPGVPARADAVPRLMTHPEPGEDKQPEPERPRFRYRARVVKQGKLRFLGHLDFSRMLLRGMRRAGFTLVYSQGFNPKPRVAFGPALALGMTSDAEYLDLETHEKLDPERAIERLNAALPEGAAFTALRPIPRDVPGLGESIRAARYLVAPASDNGLRERVDAFLGRESVIVERRSRDGRVRTFDLRKELLSVEVGESGALRMLLAVHSNGASARPDEALRELLGEGGEAVRVSREDLLVDWRGRLVDPLLAAAATDVDRAAS